MYFQIFITKYDVILIINCNNIIVNNLKKEGIRMQDIDKIKALRNGIAGKNRGYWKQEEKELLTKMFNEQVGITEMTVYFERTEKAIINQLDKLNLYDRVRASNKPKEGCLCSECARYAECKEKGPLCT